MGGLLGGGAKVMLAPIKLLGGGGGAGPTPMFVSTTSLKL